MVVPPEMIGVAKRYQEASAAILNLKRDLASVAFLEDKVVAKNLLLLAQKRLDKLVIEERRLHKLLKDNGVELKGKPGAKHFVTKAKMKIPKSVQRQEEALCQVIHDNGALLATQIRLLGFTTEHLRGVIGRGKVKSVRGFSDISSSHTRKLATHYYLSPGVLRDINFRPAPEKDALLDFLKGGPFVDYGRVLLYSKKYKKLALDNNIKVIKGKSDLGVGLHYYNSPEELKKINFVKKDLGTLFGSKHLSEKKYDNQGPQKMYTEEELEIVDKFIELYEDQTAPPKAIHELAKRLGRKYRAVFSFVKNRRRNLGKQKVPKEPWTEEQTAKLIEMITEMRDDGDKLPPKAYKFLGEIFGRTEIAIHQKVTRLKREGML